LNISVGLVNAELLGEANGGMVISVVYNMVPSVMKKNDLLKNLFTRYFMVVSFYVFHALISSCLIRYEKYIQRKYVPILTCYNF
jgi:hypothetical protein